MSASPDSPPDPSMDVEESSLVPNTQSSDTVTEPLNIENLQQAPVLESLNQDPVHSDPRETVVNDSPCGDKDSNDASTTDMPLMDWAEFESEYKKALIEANEVEDKLVLEFEKLSKAFVFWAEASAQHDNDRAWKRLKTRERYVQLSEQKLEEKKKHYVEVVQAFQSALKLLGA